MTCAYQDLGRADRVERGLGEKGCQTKATIDEGLFGKSETRKKTRATIDVLEDRNMDMEKKSKHEIPPFLPRQTKRGNVSSFVRHPGRWDQRLSNSKLFFGARDVIDEPAQRHLLSLGHVSRAWWMIDMSREALEA
ncbi:hypothetical protein AWENTII_004869 [Aspergillus wentii]